jgi:hypothetical protein
MAHERLLLKLGLIAASIVTGACTDEIVWMDPQTACDAIDLPVPERGRQFELSVLMAPGDDREFCQLVRLTEDLNVTSAEIVYTDGSHHGHLERTRYNASNLPTHTVENERLDGTILHDCKTPSALWDIAGVVDIGRAAGPDEDEDHAHASPPPPLVLPEGVAMRLRRDEYILLNFHIENADAEPKAACLKANLHSVPAERVQHEAGMLFWFSPMIALPARGTATARMACELTQDISLTRVVSHMHKHGVNFEARLRAGDPGANGSFEEPGLETAYGEANLYKTNIWNQPPPKDFAAPLQLRKGQWIDYKSDYKNPYDHNVAQGLQTTDEMSMFLGWYFPRHEELEDCGRFENDQNLRVYGSGTFDGADVAACLGKLNEDKAAGRGSGPVFTGGGPETSEARFETWQCLSNTCPELSDELVEFGRACKDMGRKDLTAEEVAECGAALCVLTGAECSSAAESDTSPLVRAHRSADCDKDSASF